MSTTITGVVTNGVIVPASPLPEGARVAIQLQDNPPPQGSARVTSTELRKMPRQDRQAVLAVAAELAEQDYRDDKDLTGFEAFSEEINDDSH